MEKTKVETHHFRNFFLLVLAILLLFVVWARFVSTGGLIIKEYSIIDEKIPYNFHGMKIIHFSDLHFGRTIDNAYVKKLVKTINDYKPELIIFTGDLFDKDILLKDEEVLNVGNILSQLNPVIGSFAVKGNHDYEKDYFDKAMEVAGFNVLLNATEFIYYKDITPLKIIGLPSLIKEKYTYEETSEEEELYTILLAHEPDIIDEYSHLNINLMLSGHSHGGQIRLPFIGAVITPIGAKNYYDAYYKLKTTDLYISSGLGTSELDFRFLNKPSINLYRMYTN